VGWEVFFEVLSDAWTPPINVINRPTFNLIYLTDQPDELRRQLRDCILCLSGLDSSPATSEGVPLDAVTPPVIGEMFDFRTQTVEALERLKSGGTV
jgi:hypothetical protein